MIWGSWSGWSCVSVVCSFVVAWAYRRMVSLFNITVSWISWKRKINFASAQTKRVQNIQSESEPRSIVSSLYSHLVSMLKTNEKEEKTFLISIQWPKEERIDARPISLITFHRLVDFYPIVGAGNLLSIPPTLTLILGKKTIELICWFVSQNRDRKVRDRKRVP